MESYQGQHLSESDRSEDTRQVRASKFLGMSHDTLSKAKQVIEKIK